MGGKLPPHSWRRSRFTSAQMSTFSEGGEKEGPFLKKKIFFLLCQPWPKCHSVVCHRARSITVITAPLVNVFVCVQQSQAAE